jgi:hypothetical protein
MSTQSQPDHDPKETTKLKLNAPRLIAGTLAAVTGAALSSRLGVAGTLVGTGFISLISGTAATVYEHSVERGRVAVRNRLSALEENGGLVRLKSTRVPSPDETRPLAPGAPAEPREHGRLRSYLTGLVHSPGRRWAMAGAGALATFVVALGIVTVIEVAHGSSLSGSGHRTTLGQAFSDSGHSTPQDQRRSPTPSGTPSGSTPSNSAPSSGSPSSSPSTSVSPSPSDSPTSSSPSTTPSTTPSQHSTQSTTTAPPTSAPTQTPSSPPATPSPQPSN